MEYMKFTSGTNDLTSVYEVCYSNHRGTAYVTGRKTPIFIMASPSSEGYKSERNACTVRGASV